MRLLFTSAGGSGHSEPLLPLARAAVAAGHDVAFSCRPWMAPVLEAQGFRVFAAGPDEGLVPVRKPLAPVDPERAMRGVGPGFGLRIARSRARDLAPVCAAWRPDAFVCDETDFGAMVIAERFGLPHATVEVCASGAFVRAEHVAPSLDVVRAENGLAPDSALAAPARHLVLSPFPPSLRDPAAPRPATLRRFRAVPPAPTAPRAPRARPLVCFTLGTVFNLECGDLFARVLAGLRTLPLDVVVTVGRDVDPAELGPQPPHVRVERWIAQDELLRECAVAVSHGGSGSVLGALAHGVSMLLLPLGADQPLNAARCAALGAARVQDAATATPDAVRAAVAALLHDAAYAAAAARLRAEIAALPDASQALHHIERLLG
ncbi:MAG: glycosyltransferase [Proteobacteria bacterium]|nr:MAG: glycosyltransferase [Pseudomonadota bacterium]